MLIESLPIILQISLLLTCGLSRYMWFVNTSVPRAVASFTILGALFYIGIVVVGTSSYERACLCPTSSYSPIPLRRTSENCWRACLCLIPPRSSSPLGSTPTGDSFWHPIAFVASYNPGKFLSRISSGIRSVATKVEHQTIILLLQIDRALRNSKQRLVRETRRFRHAVLLLITVEDVHHQSLISPNSPGYECVYGTWGVFGNGTRTIPAASAGSSRT